MKNIETSKAKIALLVCAIVASQLLLGAAFFAVSH
jgi:hypothetical protein